MLEALMPARPEGRVLVLVDPFETVPRPAAVVAARRHDLELLAVTPEDLGTIVMHPGVEGVVVVPPVGQGDAFATIASVRRRAPSTPAAIVLGPPRGDGIDARVLWVHQELVPACLLAAVAAVAALRTPVDELAWWDQATAVISVLDAPAHLEW